MIRVLIVEDDPTKFGRLYLAVKASNVAPDDIHHVISAAEAIQELRAKKFDLLLLDVNLPKRPGERPQRGVAVDLLKEMRRDESVMLPRYIVGVTAFVDVVAEFGEQFSDQLWTLILYTENSDQWIEQIATKIAYIEAAKISENFSDGKTFGVDLAVVCALEGVEFNAIRSLPLSWQPLRLQHDETRYISATIEVANKSKSLIAAAAPRMGMSASAVLASKVIAQFRPRILAMVGICAGRFGKANIGDVIVADPCWDWGSGKIETKDDHPTFRPAPHQIEIDTDVLAQLKDCCVDVSTLAKIKEQFPGNKPHNEIKVHFAPLASGASVIASAEVFEELLSQHRNLTGIEMEAYAVALACKGSGKPRPHCVIMKAVCDFADKDKTDDYQAYAAHTSSRLLLHAAHTLLA